MSRFVTHMTKSNRVLRGVAQGRVRPPRFDVMDLQLPAACPAGLAGPVVSDENGVTKCLVLRRVEGLVSHGAYAALPVRMTGADKMRVLRRNAARPSGARADGLLVGVTQRSASQRAGDCQARLLSRIGRHELGLSVPDTSGIRDFCPDFWVLGNVVVEIAPRCRA